MTAPGPRRTWKVQRCMIRGRKTHAAWRDGPCRVQSPTTSTRSEDCWVGWTRRALPALRSCSTFKCPWGGKKLQFVPDDSLLNKAFTSTILYLCSFIQFQSRYFGADSTISQVSGHTAARARVRGADKFGNLSVITRVIGPNPAGIQAPEGSW